MLYKQNPSRSPETSRDKHLRYKLIGLVNGYRRVTMNRWVMSVLLVLVSSTAWAQPAQQQQQQQLQQQWVHEAETPVKTICAHLKAHAVDYPEGEHDLCETLMGDLLKKFSDEELSREIVPCITKLKFIDNEQFTECLGELAEPPHPPVKRRPSFEEIERPPEIRGPAFEEIEAPEKPDSRKPPAEELEGAGPRDREPTFEEIEELEAEVPGPQDFGGRAPLFIEKPMPVNVERPRRMEEMRRVPVYAESKVLVNAESFKVFRKDPANADLFREPVAVGTISALTPDPDEKGRYTATIRFDRAPNINRQAMGVLSIGDDIEIVTLRGCDARECTGFVELSSLEGIEAPMKVEFFFDKRTRKRKMRPK